MRLDDSLDDTTDDSQKCSICLDSWSNAGEHRLCSLRCGHFFGHSCLKRWLDPLKVIERRCPECNTKAQKKDIRFHYAKKLTATDTSELEKVMFLKYNFYTLQYLKLYIKMCTFSSIVNNVLTIIFYNRKIHFPE